MPTPRDMRRVLHRQAVSTGLRRPPPCRACRLLCAGVPRLITRALPVPIHAQRRAAYVACLTSIWREWHARTQAQALRWCQPPYPANRCRASSANAAQRSYEHRRKKRASPPPSFESMLEPSDISGGAGSRGKEERRADTQPEGQPVVADRRTQ